MIRQYIGARYVTKIYENSTDPSSAEWESGTAYEPLTLVTYNYSSYLSKKIVPPTIGNPADNSEYWIVTGLYNGQIADLQNQIDDLQNQIERTQSLIGRKFILIGDSYSRGYDGTAGTYTYRGWAYINKEFLEAGGAEVYLLDPATSGGGFTTTPSWQSGLASLVATQNWTSDDCEKITDIVILGGTNDGSHNGITYDGLKAAIQNFFTYAKATFPNAYFKVGIVSAVLSVVCNNSAQTWKAYSETVKYGAEFVTDGALLLNNMDYIGTDETHLTLNGYEKLCPKLYDLIINGHCEYSYTYTLDLDSYLAPGITKVFSAANAKLNITYNQNEVIFRIGNADPAGTPFKIANAAAGIYTYSFLKDLPRCIPFTRKFIPNNRGVGYAGNSMDDLKFNTDVLIYAGNVAGGDNVNSTEILVQIGRPIFVRENMEFVFDITTPIPQFLFERY